MQLRGEPIDNAGVRVALDAMLRRSSRTRRSSADFDFAPARSKFVDNHTHGHSRTEYDEWPEPEKKRHLIRLWLPLTTGRRAYPG